MADVTTLIDITCPNCGCKIHIEPGLEIIHCNECVYGDSEGLHGGRYFCDYFGIYRYKDDFCSDGERKTDE